MRLAALLVIALATAGCEVIEQPSGLIPQWTSAYRQVISNDDKVRLRDWRKTFVDALAAARKAGHGAEIDREGVLLDPDSALPQPAIPNGMYRCRVIKLGAKEPGNLDFVSYPGFTCRVRPDHSMQRLSKISGSQRYVGILFPDDAIHQVFLGSLVLADERRALQYRQDDARDVVAYLERIGPNRWRLVMPQPHFESRLDVMELVPQGATT
jgi:uncharacterized protein DUF4893